ncbi:hypothetical protein SAMN05443245_5206 [Paraburkholderia fungorum]|uniref:Uncharacterized protein n=1 Tax=Paraburkholderia fungorum TaxID=134537 RepID=A0A1H1IHY7_9BURK|nr:hypothetical protein SAMN05443245_5206 [Paraburkholderia fungorum]
MKDALKVFVDAARETPRLYFAPLVGAFHAAVKVQDTMIKTQKGGRAGEFGAFEVRGRHVHKKTSTR